jgi:hypothetical protein
LCEHKKFEVERVTNEFSEENFPFFIAYITHRYRIKIKIKVLNFKLSFKKFSNNNLDFNLKKIPSLNEMF